MVRASNQGTRVLLAGKERHLVRCSRGSPERNVCVTGESRRGAHRAAQASEGYFAAAAAYFLRNLSTRPAVSTIFCLPV